MIKNVVFDIGNVLVRWDPHYITYITFPNAENKEALYQNIFKNQLWYDLNLGKISENEAIDKYHDSLNISKNKLEELMHNVKVTQVPIAGSVTLLGKLYEKGYNLFSLTDNIREILKYLTSQYNFFKYFKAIVSSCEIGYLKPNKEIYEYLLKNYNLIPSETIFMDDIEKNVEGAKNLGINAFQFTDIQKALEQLKQYDVDVA